MPSRMVMIWDMNESESEMAVAGEWNSVPFQPLHAQIVHEEDMTWPRPNLPMRSLC